MLNMNCIALVSRLQFKGKAGLVVAQNDYWTSNQKQNETKLPDKHVKLILSGKHQSARKMISCVLKVIKYTSLLNRIEKLIIRLKANIST